MRDTPPAFGLAEAKALRFVDRAVRRGQGNAVAPAEHDFPGENLSIDPNWNLGSLRGTAYGHIYGSMSFEDTEDTVKDLLSQARQAGVITSTVGDAGISFAIDSNGLFSWTVIPDSWRGFALCDRAGEELRKLGIESDADSSLAPGAQTAMAILRHAPTGASAIIREHHAYYSEAFPALGRRPPRQTRTAGRPRHR